MTTKTEFEEIWSAIKYSDQYETDSITFFYEDRHGLRPLKVKDIHTKRKRMLEIERITPDGWEIVEIPVYKIWLIQYKKEYILDRRASYQGYKNLKLPHEKT